MMKIVDDKLEAIKKSEQLIRRAQGECFQEAYKRALKNKNLRKVK